MNKYQEALQKIASLVYEASKETLNAEDCEEYLTLEELVDRATEIEPFNESLADYMCPMCGAGLSFDALNDPIECAPKFCSNCGQKFDLSKIKEVGKIMSRRAKLTLYTDRGGFLSLECPKCGNRLGDFDKYCSKCGTEIDKSPDDFEDALDWLIEKILDMGIELENIPGTESYHESAEDLFDSEKIKYVALKEGIKSRSNAE